MVCREFEESYQSCEPRNRCPTLRYPRGDFKLSVIQRLTGHAYKVMGLDEHRKAYAISRWYQYIPKAALDKRHHPPPHVEQRWFVGAHSNVGGGYWNDLLAQSLLEWLRRKAESVGFRSRYSMKLFRDEHHGQACRLIPRVNESFLQSR